MAKSRSRTYEGSAADLREDKRQARRRGLTMKEWEASAADKAEDAAHQRAMDVKASKHRPGAHHPPHHFAHAQPRTD